MVFSIDKWMEQYINVMQNEFHDRIWFLDSRAAMVEEKLEIRAILM